MVNWPGTLPLSALDKLKLESAYDESLRQRLRQDAASVLNERGIDVPQGVSVNVVEDTMESHTIALPPFVGSDLSPEALERANATSVTWECTTCTLTTPICAGSLASLICVTKNC
jgi:hypothetical protein